MSARSKPSPKTEPGTVPESLANLEVAMRAAQELWGVSAASELTNGPRFLPKKAYAELGTIQTIILKMSRGFLTGKTNPKVPMSGSGAGADR